MKAKIPLKIDAWHDYGDKYMTYDSRHARQLLILGTGQPDASFREGQEEAIAHVVDGRGRLLLV